MPDGVIYARNWGALLPAEVDQLTTIRDRRVTDRSC